MKILLISPIKSLEEKRRPFKVSSLPLDIIKGLTPAEHKVKIVEEEFEDIDLDEKCDLVGITCLTSTAYRAYWLSEEFRKRKRKVILGGIHPSILPEEAIQHADSVVIGEAEGVWENLIQDFLHGRLQRFYHSPNPSLERYIERKADRRKGIFNFQAIFTTKGCPYRCPFCTVSYIYGEKIRHRPIEHVIKDIQQLRTFSKDIFVFADDNITGDTNYAKRLFQEIKPYEIEWGAQSSISIAYDKDLLKLARESGCIWLLLGIENISRFQIASLKKSPKDIAKIEDCIKKIKDSGIVIYPSFVFGFDTDEKSIFEETYEFVIKNKITINSFNILTPYPGTRIFEKFKNEGRLLTTTWKYYDLATVVFKPKNMTPAELQEGVEEMNKRVSKTSIIVQRCIEQITQPMWLLANLAWFVGAKRWTRDAYRRVERIKAGKYDW